MKRKNLDVQSVIINGKSNGSRFYLVVIYCLRDTEEVGSFEQALFQGVIASENISKIEYFRR